MKSNWLFCFYSMEIIRFIKITADECWAYAIVDVLFGQIHWGYTIDGELSIKEHVAGSKLRTVRRLSNCIGNTGSYVAI